MDLKPIALAGIILLVALISIFILIGSDMQEKPLSIGWLTSVATQGQHVLVLKNTGVLENNGLKADFHGFSYAPPLTEAALAGAFDIAFLADIPALKLIEKDPDWVIVARHVDFRAGITVPKNSGISSLQGLKGKTIVTPLGSATHVYAAQAIRGAGLDPETEVKFVNLDILEQASIVEKGTDSSWGEVDAIISWDPSIAIFEESGKGKLLEEVNPKQVMVMRKSFIKNNPEKASTFMQAFREAFLFYAQNRFLADSWYIQESRVSFPQKILDISTGCEPNLKAKSIEDITIVLTDEQIQKIQNAADFATEIGVLNRMHSVRDEIDFSLMTIQGQ